MSISPSDVTIKVKNSIDHRGEYKAFRTVTAVIEVRGEKAGSIDAVIVDRKRIPDNTFDSAMDGHSDELQFIFKLIFEPKLGRTRVKSLKDGGDDENCPFLYIEYMYVAEEYKEGGQNSDVATYALHMFLHDPYVQKRKISSCICILDPRTAMTRQEKNEHEEYVRHGQFERADEEKEHKMNQFARLDADPYLRNGFYQDEAVARMPKNAARILLATPSQWNQPLKMQNEVTAIQLLVPTRTPNMAARDAEIFELTKTSCDALSSPPVTALYPGDNFSQNLFQMLMSQRNEGRVSTYRSAVALHLQQGGSLVRSNALHAACGLNDASIVRCILQMDPSTVSGRDQMNVTPLMVAATSAAARRNNTGFSSDHSVIDTLLAAGADKNATNSEGLTAYGMFLSAQKEFKRMMQAFSGPQSPDMLIPGYAALEAKLRPRNGPTPADLTGGDSEKPGIIHYGEDNKGKRKRAKRG